MSYQSNLLNCGLLSFQKNMAYLVVLGSNCNYYTTKDTGHASGRISLHSGGSNRRHDSTAFITNAGKLSVGKLCSCVSETAGAFSKPPERNWRVFFKFLACPRLQPRLRVCYFNIYMPAFGTADMLSFVFKKKH